VTANATSDVALVLAAHGDRGGGAPNQTLLAHCERLAASGQFKSVTAGVFRGNPSLEDALRAAEQSRPARIFVYPMFMAAGYFTNQKLPERIAGAQLSNCCLVLPPMGLDPALPAMMLKQAITTAREARLDPAHARLLVVGHGSAGARASAKSTERVACWLRKKQVFAYTEAAFLEEEPFLNAQLQGQHPATVVIGFFSGDGLHAAEDVPGAIALSGADAVYAGPVGRLTEVTALIQSAALRALGLPAHSQLA
jgi:sirohydrochlorin ferrochelatase